MLGNMIGYISAVSDPKGIAVGVCGPLSLAEEVKKVVGSVDGPRRSTVGGLDLHEEYALSFYLPFYWMLVANFTALI